ncbi:MAG TPA: helix-turn-helix domain-containing protein [Thermoanaerobaculia bacterium]|nr:helix-turn-helix domain-containing protein [Thermoanaerobaculia bacterium]
MSHRRKEEERKPRPWEVDRDGGPDSFGDWLKRQRSLREISLREISDVTKISLRYLEALEENRFSVLPAAVFARGFLREYARYVGLDPDEVVNYYSVAQQDQEPEGTPSKPRPRRLHSSTQWLYGLVLTGGVVGLFGVVAAVSFWAERRPASVEPPPIAAPVFAPAPPPPVAETSGAPLEVTLDFTENCWVEAILDGSERISELRVQGESLRLRATESVALTLGNAAGVRIEVNGRPFEIAGGSGTVRAVEITLDSLRAAEAPDSGAGGSSL